MNYSLINDSEEKASLFYLCIYLYGRFLFPEKKQHLFSFLWIPIQADVLNCTSNQISCKLNEHDFRQQEDTVRGLCGSVEELQTNKVIARALCQTPESP